MKSLVCYSKDDIRTEDVEIPRIGEKQALIRTIFCGLCGSDIVKIIDPGVKKPVKLGHEVIGIVEKVGPKVRRLKVKDIIVVSHHIPCFNCVYCDHKNYSMCKHFKRTNLDPQGFSEYIRLSSEHIEYNTFVITNEKNIGNRGDIKNLIFTEPLACCLRAVERANISPGDMVMVVGCGTIGIIFISLFNLLYDARVIAVDIDDNKLDFSKKFGADLTINSANEDVKEKVFNFSCYGVDIVELTFTSKATLTKAIDCVRDGGCIQIFAGPSGNREIPVDFESLYKREITILPSYSAAPEQLRKSFNYLKEKKLDFSPLISNILPIEEFRKGLDLALSQKAFKILYYFNKELIKWLK